MQEVLAIRRSSGLFRLRTGADVQQRLRFLNTGPTQLPGLIAFTLADDEGAVDRANTLVAVLVNAHDEALSLAAPQLAGRPLRLHPIQAASSDPVVRTAKFTAASNTFTVPARTAAVFVSPRPAAERITLLEGDVSALVAEGALNAGQGNALRAKLSAAGQHLAHGNVGAARNSLDAFIHQVEAFEHAGILTGEQAGALEGEAREVMAML
jgi:hypothetical protein